jgi:hypothetical protein
LLRLRLKRSITMMVYVYALMLQARGPFVSREREKINCTGIRVIFNYAFYITLTSKGSTVNFTMFLLKWLKKTYPHEQLTRGFTLPVQAFVRNTYIFVGLNVATTQLVYVLWRLFQHYWWRKTLWRTADVPLSSWIARNTYIQVLK